MLKSKLNSALVAALLFAGANLVIAQKETPLVTQSEDKWIAVLKSEAPQKEKADACRELAVIGTKKSIPALAAMLADEKMNHMARYALETIPDSTVDEIFRTSLSQLTGRPLIGVIASVGVRQDEKAVEALAKLLKSRDQDVPEAAGRALGKIGNLAAAKSIESALSDMPANRQLPLFEGLFRCAESLSAKGKTKDAIATYDFLRSVKEPHQVRAGALRGAILTRGRAGIPLLLEAIRSEDWILVDAAARTAIEMPIPDVTPAVAGEIAKASTDKQVLLSMVLGKRADAAALPALYAAAKSGDKAARIAAIRAMPEIGSPLAAPTLGELLGDAEKDVAKSAQESLGGLKGPEVDALILTMLSSGDVPHRLAAAELIGRRRMTSAVPALVKAGSDTDAGVRSSAVARVGELAQPAELPNIMGLLSNAKTAEDLNVVAQALSSVCSRSTSPETCVDTLIVGRASLQPAQQGALMRVLASAGGAKALTVVRESLSQSDKNLRAAAVRALAEWKSADAAPDLFQIAKTTDNASERSLVFNNYLRLCTESDAPAAQRLKMITDVTGLATTPQDKWLLLSAMGEIQNVQSLKLAAQYLSDAQLADEAGAAVVKISAKLTAENKSELAPALNQVLKSSKAKRVLDEARKQMQRLGIEAL